MTAMLKIGRHVELLHTFFKRIRSMCEIMCLYHNLKDSSTFGQLYAALLLILLRITA